MKKLKMVVSILIMLSIIAMAGMANAAEGDPVGLRWDAPVVTDNNRVFGYHVHWGKEAGVYPNRLDVGNITRLLNIVEVLKLDSNTTYYFVVTAYNNAGDSGYSNSPDYLTPFVLQVPPGVTITIEVADSP